MAIEINWSERDGPEDECECFCGHTFYSYAKTIYTNEGTYTVTQVPCPQCGSTENHLRRISTPPETWTIKG